MGALPKNKITSVERGKRRRGNTPKLKKDINSAIPNYKKGFMAELLQFIGLETAPQKASKSSEAASPKLTNVAPVKAVKATNAQTTVKTNRITQHKG